MMLFAWGVKVPINPNFFFASRNLCIALSKMAQKFLFLGKTGIFYEFLKCGFLCPRPGKRETGPSDVIPGH